MGGERFAPALGEGARAHPDAGEREFFSIGSLWEIAIKASLRRVDFVLDATELRNGLLANGNQELPILASHVLFTSRLAAIHKDPFDRLLVAQALVEGLTLITSDEVVASYSAAIFCV